jgi:uncharacterized protein with HEPN domain
MFRDDASLLDILNACRAIREFTAGMSFKEYASDYKTQLSVQKLFEIIGEATRRLSPGIMDAHKEIPWSRMIGMRNIMSHQYDNINFEIVWKVVQTDIPALITKLAPIVPPEE